MPPGGQPQECVIGYKRRLSLELLCGLFALMDSQKVQIMTLVKFLAHRRVFNLELEGYWIFSVFERVFRTIKSENIVLLSCERILWLSIVFFLPCFSIQINIFVFHVIGKYWNIFTSNKFWRTLIVPSSPPPQFKWNYWRKKTFQFYPFCNTIFMFSKYWKLA